MKRKVLALMLISALLLSLFAGCGAAESVQSQQEAASVSAAAPETDAEVETPAEASEEAPESAIPEAEEITNTVSYPITEEPLTLSIFWQFHMFLSMFNVTQDVIATIPTFQMAEEATGVKLDFHLVGEENFGNSLQLLWASGDYCDLITNAEREYTAGVDSAVEQEVLLDLVPYLE